MAQLNHHSQLLLFGGVHTTEHKSLSFKHILHPLASHIDAEGTTHCLTNLRFW